MDGAVKADFNRSVTAFVRDGALVNACFKAFDQTDVDSHGLVDELAIGKCDVKGVGIFFVVQRNLKAFGDDDGHFAFAFKVGASQFVAL